jgi:hypothetical protein
MLRSLIHAACHCGLTRNLVSLSPDPESNSGLQGGVNGVRMR